MQEYSFSLIINHHYHAKSEREYMNTFVIVGLGGFLFERL